MTEDTPHHPAEPHLVDEFTLLRVVVDAVSDPIFCKDRAGRYLLSNRAHAVRMRLPQSECLGKTVFEIPQLAEYAALYDAADRALFESGEPSLNREEPFTRADGSKGCCLTSKFPLRNQRGEIVGLVGVSRDISERRQAERVLDEERRLLRTVIDAVADPIFFKDQAGCFVLVNDAYQRLFELGTDAVLGRSDLEIERMHGYAERYAADDRHVLDSGLPLINREEPYPMADGRSGWFLTSKFPLRDGEGRVIGLVGIARDITEMRRATDELARTREKLFDHVENSPLAVVEWSPDFRIERWGGQAEAMFGWTAAEVIGRHFGDWAFVVPDDLPAVMEIGGRLMDGSDRRNVSRNRNLTTDGRVLHCVWHNSGLHDADGRLVSVLSLVEDVTDRVRAEQAARESQQLYHTLVEATDTGYVVIDGAGCVIEGNAEYVRQTGHRSIEEIRGRRVDEWTAPHDLERNAREVEKCVRTGSTHNLEIDYRWPDGRILPIEVSARVIDDSAGRRIIALCRDISARRTAEDERQQIERKLQEAQKLESLGVLAGGIAHDFNNLLTGILGNASLAAMDLPPDSPVLGFVEQIETASTRAAELCQQMLAYSGRGRFVIRDLDLNKVIAETTELLRVSISKRAHLTLDLARGLAAVKADGTQIRQVVMNLVINASEAIGESGGDIRVRTGLLHTDRATFEGAHLAPEIAAGNYVFLEVCDDGCGMPDEVRQRIFDPFFTTKFTGRGLGLAAVLGIVRGHGGALQVETEPGRGTTFRVLLPASQGMAEIEARSPASPSEWRGSGTVLVIDDEPTVSRAAGQILRSLGFEVRLASDGVEGLEIFRADPQGFALVLLDLTMPRMGGEEVCKALHELRPELPVILVSGFNEVEVATRFGEGGPAAFIQKPFGIATLRESLRAVLG
ncbi:MAG: PAS domain S-box protein [Chthoniobacteraceae bacterium]